MIRRSTVVLSIGANEILSEPGTAAGTSAVVDVPLDRVEELLPKHFR